MRVPLLDLKPQFEQLQAEIRAAVDEVLSSTRYILGPRVEQLEAEVAAYCGTPHAVGLSSGTDALLAALMALDVGPGDKVITPVYSFFASAGVVSRLGAKPIFLDIDPTTYNLDPQALADYLAQHGGEGVKAIIAVHLYGQCADMDALSRVACENDIPVIEDAAQAIGASYPSTSHGETRRAGAMGMCGCFSFFPAKNLGGVGDGGMLVTNDADFAEKVRKLRMHGETTRYHHAYVGGNFRLDPIQAAVLSVKLPHLEQWHAARRAHAAVYDQRLPEFGVQTPAAVYGREHHIYNQYIISTPRDRDGLKQALDSAGIGNAIYYPVPFHMQECFQPLGYAAGAFPRAEYAAQHTLALPVYPDLTPEMQDTVIAALADFYAPAATPA